ncbi:MAG: AI-2E family transporter [Eubacterium sp.]|nr:AI-2E family transporter [Eubacterium sp.]
MFKSKSFMEKVMLIAFGVILTFAIFNFSKIWGSISFLLGIASPIFTGIVIAFILNIPMNFFERYILVFMDKVKNERLRRRGKRALAIIMTFLAIALVITGIVTFVIPQLTTSVEMLVVKFPGYVESFNQLINDLLTRFKLPDVLWTDISGQWETYAQKLTGIVINSVPEILDTTRNITQGFVNFIMSLILSIYMLADKERLLALKDKLIYAYIPDKAANFIREVGTTANSTFQGFIGGQITEAFILGSLCALGLGIFRIPYALLIGVFVGMTSVIPVFGAFLGALPGAFILLVVNPLYCLFFVIFLVCLQQFEGNVIYPKVVGSSVGLSGLWVLIGMLLGGSLFGFTGMIVGIPCFAVFYSVFRTITNDRVAAKRKREEKDLLERSFEE